MQRNHTLHLGNIHVPLRCPTVEGRENGGPSETCSAQECHFPCLCEFLVHLRVECIQKPYNFKCLGEGNGTHLSPMLVAAQASTTANSASDSGNTPEGGSPAESSAFEGI